MGNCVSCVKGKNESSSSITLAIIGPDNAGKTTLSSFLAGDPVDPEVSPTVGFSNVKFTMKKFDITMYDLGGGKNIRPIWKNYFNEIYGIVYMVDSSTPQRVKEARDLLRDTLEHPQVSGKPLLVLANKADVEGHMDEVDILNQLDLDQTVNANNCPSQFVMISALQSSKAKMKKVINGGFMWLLDTIHSSMDKIEPRVKEDMGAMKEMRDKEREERRERVRKQREEREKKEDQERKRLGISKEPESDDEDIKGDPFKPLDYNKLKLKEEKLKSEKKRRQELAAGKLGSRDRNDLNKMKDDANIGYSMDDTMTLPRFGKQPGSRFGRNGDLDGLDISQSSALMLSGRNTRPTALPPLEPIGSQSLDSKMNSDKKKGKKKKGEESMRNDDDDLYGRSGLSLYGSRSSTVGKTVSHEWNEDSLKMARDDVKRRSEFSYKSSRLYDDDDDDDDRDVSRSSRTLDSLGRLDFPLVSSSHSDPHDLTPRVAKPKNSRVVRTGRIDEDENEDATNQYKNMRLSLKEYGDPRMTQKLDEYRDKYALRSSSDAKVSRSLDNNKYTSDKYSKDGRKWDKSYDREDSMYRKSLKDISPPDLDRFDDDENEYKDEGIEDDSESDLGRYSKSKSKGKYGSYGTKDRKKDENANNRRSRRYSDEEDEDEEEDDYRSKNVLKNTLKFSRHEDEGRNYNKEMNDLRNRRDNDYNKSYTKESRFSRDRMDSDDDRMDRHRSRTPEQPDNRRKKKKNILKSNKRMPSDDEEDEGKMSQYYSSPRLVQERGSRNTSDADTPSKGRNSKTTYFHSGSSRESDLGRKWGLAEDLPAIDNDSRMHRNYRPNYYDDSEGEDVVF